MVAEIPSENNICTYRIYPQEIKLIFIIILTLTKHQNGAVYTLTFLNNVRFDRMPERPVPERSSLTSG